MLEVVIAGLATSSLARMGRQLEIAATSRREKQQAEQLRASSLLTGVSFDKSLLRATVELPVGVSSADVETFLRSTSAEGLAYELLTVCMAEPSGSPSHERIRDRWEAVAACQFPEIVSATTELFEMLQSHYEIAVRLVELECPSAYAAYKEESQHRRIACVLESIDTRLAGSTSKAIAIGDIAKFVETYRKQLRAAHQNITPPDFERRRDVPIHELYVSPTITSLSSPGPERTLVKNLAQEIDRTVLLGDPGHGKSTASQVLVHKLAGIPTGPVPILVVLRDFAGSKIASSVVKHIESLLDSVYQCPPPPGAVEYLLETGQALVVFDGLDELLDTTHRRSVTDVVHLFCSRYPLARVLVTSRKVGYFQAPMEASQFRVLQLSGFDREQVGEYVEKWFGQEDLNDTELEMWTSSFMRESESVSDLTSTPLLLALMCIIYRGERSLPKNRPLVYERCANMLFEKWDSRRGIHADLLAGQSIDPAMKHLAFWLLTRGDADGVTEVDLIRETTKYLYERSFEHEAEATAAAREFIEFCRGRAWVFSDVGTTADGDHLYKFTHRTFLEYFGGYHLARTTDTPEKLARKLAPRVSKGEWDVVAQLAVQICDKHTDKGAIRIFSALLNDKRKRTTGNRMNILSFLARCLDFVQISPKLVRKLTREVLDNAFRAAISETQPTVAENFAVYDLVHSTHHANFDVVSEEFSNVIVEAIEGSDVTHKKLALSLISRPALVLGLYHQQTPIAESQYSWTEVIEGLRDRYRPIFMEELGRSREFASVCLHSGWIDMATYLRAFDEGLDPLFRRVEYSFSRVGFIDFATEIVLWWFRGGEQYFLAPRESYLEEFEEVAVAAAALIEEGRPLCTSAPIYVLGRRSDWAEEGRGEIQLDERQMLGLGILFACWIERGEGQIGVEDMEDMPLEILRPIRHRMDKAKDDTLGECTEFEAGSLLWRWARREVSFVEL